MENRCLLHRIITVLVIVLFIFAILDPIEEVRSAKCHKCHPMNPTIDLFLVKYFRSLPYSIYVVSDPCQGMIRRFYYHWKVKDYISKVVKEKTGLENYFRIYGYEYPVTKNTWRLPFERWFMVTVNLSYFSDFHSGTYTGTIFQFKYDDVILFLSCGPEKTHPPDEDLIVHINHSFHRSFSPQEDSLDYLRAHWWSFNVKVNQKYGSRNRSICIPEDVLENGTTVRIEFEVYSHRGREPHLFSRIRIKEGSPACDIVCHWNCEYVNIEDVFILEAVCTECFDEYFKLDWNITGSPGFNESNEVVDGKYYVVPPDTMEFLNESCPLKAMAFIGDDYYYKYENRIRNFTLPGECELTRYLGINCRRYHEITCKKFFSDWGDLTLCVYFGDPVKTYHAHMAGCTRRRYLSFTGPYYKHNVTITAEYIDDRMYKAYWRGNISMEHYGSPLLYDIQLETQFIIYGTHIYSMKNSVIVKNYPKALDAASCALRGVVVAATRLSIQKKADTLHHVGMYLKRLDMFSFLMGIQLLSNLRLLAEALDNIDTNTMHLVGDLCAKYAKRLREYVYDDSNYHIPQLDIVKMTARIMKILSIVLVKIPALADVLDTMTEEDVDTSFYYAYDDILSYKVGIRRNLGYFLQSFIRAMDYAINARIRKTVPNQRGVRIAYPGFVLAFRRVKPMTLAGRTLDFRSIRAGGILQVFIPKDAVLEWLKYESLVYYVGELNKAPFCWDPSRDIKRANVLIFGLFHENMSLTSSASPLEFILPISTANSKSYQGFFLREPVVFRIDVPPSSYISFLFNIDHEGGRYAVGGCPVKAEDMAKVGIRTSWLDIPPVKERELYLTFYHLDQNTTSKFWFKVRAFGCSRWNDRVMKWTSANIDPIYRNERLICRSKHLSVYGAHFLFPEVRREGLRKRKVPIYALKNMKIFYLVAFIVLLFIVLMIWATIRDVRLKRSFQIARLRDNVPGDKYGYIVVVLTGSKCDAGTTANVVIQLVGCLAESRAHILRSCDYFTLQERGEDWFILYAPYKLGDIRAIRLWHDTLGSRPHWYCSRVVVQDLDSTDQYCFIVEKWFSLIYGDGVVYREIPVTTFDKLSSAQGALGTIVSKTLRNDHLWLSIFTSDPQTNFTTKERVLVAMTTLALAMLFCSLFSGLPSFSPNDVIVNPSHFHIRFIDVAIVLISFTLAFLIGTGLSLLFMKSRPRRFFMLPCEKTNEPPCR